MLNNLKKAICILKIGLSIVMVGSLLSGCNVFITQNKPASVQAPSPHIQPCSNSTVLLTDLQRPISHRQYMTQNGKLCVPSRILR